MDEYNDLLTIRILEDKLELVELSLRSILENPEIKTEQIKKSLSEILKEIR